MVSKLSLARELLAHHERLTSTGQPPLCFIGFDGFTDEIVRVVDQRLDVRTFEPFYTIADFGKRIIAAAGRSCNLELVPTETRLGGNAPLLTQALLQGGHRIIFAGAIGQHGVVEPIFQSMASRCLRTIPLSPSGHTDALEFYDGKIFLGKMGGLSEISYETLTQKISEDELVQIFDSIDLFASANWTMLPYMNALWRSLLERVIPRCAVRDQPRHLFVDLADTSKRSVGDLVEALQLLPAFQPTFQVSLGLNHAESQQVYHALIGSPPGSGPNQVDYMARAIRKHLGLSRVVVHATRFAVGAGEEGTARVEGAYCAEPKISTGGGDHFNAGYCNAILYGLPLEACLLSGVATSGYYVRHARSPTIIDLAAFLEQWHNAGSNFDTHHS